jgi:hypothetical protein
MVLGYEVEGIAQVPLPTIISMSLSIQIIAPNLHFDFSCVGSDVVEKQVIVGLRTVGIVS